LGVHDTFDRNDEGNQVFAGACDGLRNIQWIGSRIQGIVLLGAAVVGVKSLTLKQFGANGDVQVSWTGN
jgi:GTP-dependent phosphoenolpyruvate carboxykinase